MCKVIDLNEYKKKKTNIEYGKTDLNDEINVLDFLNSMIHHLKGLNSSLELKKISDYEKDNQKENFEDHWNRMMNEEDND